MKGLFEPKDREVRSDDPYTNTKREKVPQYTPSVVKPSLDSLVDTRKYGQLLKSINESNVPEEEKQFLRLAATRHIAFKYALIADYYANSDKEMQELMEQSALVLIDFDDAIRNGYVTLTEDIQEIMNRSGVKIDK